MIFRRDCVTSESCALPPAAGLPNIRTPRRLKYDLHIPIRRSAGRRRTNGMSLIHKYIHTGRPLLHGWPADDRNVTPPGRTAARPRLEWDGRGRWMGERGKINSLLPPTLTPRLSSLTYSTCNPCLKLEQTLHMRMELASARL